MRFMKAARSLASIELVSLAVRSADMTAVADIKRPARALVYKRYDRVPATLKSCLSTFTIDGLAGETACAGAVRVANGCPPFGPAETASGVQESEVKTMASGSAGPSSSLSDTNFHYLIGDFLRQESLPKRSDSSGSRQGGCHEGTQDSHRGP